MNPYNEMNPQKTYFEIKLEVLTHDCEYLFQYLRYDSEAQARQARQVLENIIKVGERLGNVCSSDWEGEDSEDEVISKIANDLGYNTHINQILEINKVTSWPV